jgi:multisubunit Na+/H+ antiporter MnhB subunit
MNLASVFGITVVAILITLYEWPKMNKNQKKEKWTFVTLTIAGWLLAVLLVFFPDMPGPTHLIDMIFKPLGKLLQK